MPPGCSVHQGCGVWARWEPWRTWPRAVRVGGQINPWGLRDEHASCDEGGRVRQDSRLSCWWRKNGQRGSRTTRVTFQISSHLSLSVWEKWRARVTILCFVSSLRRHIKQNEPAPIFKWCFKPRDSSYRNVPFTWAGIYRSVFWLSKRHMSSIFSAECHLFKKIYPFKPILPINYYDQSFTVRNIPIGGHINKGHYDGVDKWP